MLAWTLNVIAQNVPDEITAAQRQAIADLYFAEALSRDEAVPPSRAAEQLA